MALVQGRRRGAIDAAAHGAHVAAGDRIDLHVESTPIDLGLVQGFTTSLTNVTGTLQAKIDVTGSAADPHPDRRRHRRQGGVHRRADRRQLLEPAGQDRSAARQGPHRPHRRARQPPELAVDHRRPRDPRAASRRRRAVRHGQRLQGRSTTSWATSASTATWRSPASCGRRASRAISASRPARSISIEILALATDSAYATEADRVRDEAGCRRRRRRRALRSTR